MRSLWQETTRQELLGRVSRLKATDTPRWGRMSAPQMLAHLVDAARMAVGELPAAPRDLPIRYPPLKQLIVFWMPFPKGAPTSPELIARPPGDWDREVVALRALVEQFGRRDPNGRWPDHPAFGRLTGRAWGVLVYRHSDHHLRQFGV